MATFLDSPLPNPREMLSRRPTRRLRSPIALGAFELVALSAISSFALGIPRGEGGTSGGQTQLPTTGDDFFMPGTQPNPNAAEFTRVVGAVNCSFCHSDYSNEFAPLDTWVASVMGQSARDPVWQSMWVNRPAIRNGIMQVATGPGFGIELDEKMIKQFRTN